MTFCSCNTDNVMAIIILHENSEFIEVMSYYSNGHSHAICLCHTSLDCLAGQVIYLY